MNTDEMKKRTTAFAPEVIRLCEALPERPMARLMRNQFLRAGTSAGANYRASCRAKSVPDFIAKMGIVEEEMEAGIVPSNRMRFFYKEANEICAITVASIKTARGKPRRSAHNNPPSTIHHPQSL